MSELTNFFSLKKSCPTFVHHVLVSELLGPNGFLYEP